jgi:hypothetical protein
MEHPLQLPGAGGLMKSGILIGVLLLLTLPCVAGDKLTMHISPAMSFEPAVLSIRLSIEPDADNRALEVVAQSDAYFRSSMVELDGERAPRTSVFEYRSLPAGSYEVRGVLIGSDGEARATVRREVTVVAAGTQ